MSDQSSSQRGATRIDPVTGETRAPAANREPAFVVPGRDDAAAAKMRDFTASTGRRPNVVIILMDDVGWGDFGCYGGGVAVGAPTPHIDRLARQGLLLTSCYSEPSCTPTRASLMTGRLPMRHGLLIPPMYGMPGGLSGEITLPQLLSDAGYVTQAVGKWHMGENAESQPQNVGFDDFYGFLSVSDMYTEWRDPYFFPEVVYSDQRTEWVKNMPFNKCFVHATRHGDLEEVEEVTVPVLSLLDDKWCTYSERFIERMAGGSDPWFLYHCTRGAHFDNYPHPDFLGVSPAKHPYKDAIVELDAICGRLVAALERSGQLESTMVVISSDNGPEMETWPDSAFTPFRCAKGSTWEGGVRVPAVVSWPGMIEPGRTSDGLVHLLDLFATCLSMAGASDLAPADRYVDAVDQLSFFLAPDDTEAVSNRKYQHYWLTSQYSGLRVGEYKWMVSSISDDDTDVMNPGGFTGTVQRYGYGRLYNLYLDPKETHSYMIRKLVYIDALIGEMARHNATFHQWPNKPAPASAG
ncbi:MAG TPA: arylsulfatase [Acidimicrobiales bacterium]|nr:arylsulfatase [Acidimicrobiales bacterium]HXZ61426.1 arylsulfatase [Acidimicrobiales bacterium]